MLSDKRRTCNQAVVRLNNRHTSPSMILKNIAHHLPKNNAWITLRLIRSVPKPLPYAVFHHRSSIYRYHGAR